jgi:UDP-3-O-[3-hydroxymyristoyl] glucosamine N-acyltransferase
MVISTRSISCSEIVSRNPQFFIAHFGDLKRSINTVASAENAGPGSIAFLSNPKAFAAGILSSADVLVVPRKMRGKFESETELEAQAKVGDRTILVATNVELAMATVINQFFLKTPHTNQAIRGIHPTAIIAPDATLGPDVRIGPYAVIGAGVKVGLGSFIGAGTIIEDESQIGEHTVIHPQVYIGHSSLIGSRCEIHPQSVIGKEGFGYAHDERGNHYRIPHQGRVVLEDEVHIGGCCAIDRGTFGETRIEFGSKLDNHVHIAHNCRVGRNALITAGFIIAGSSQIGANFVAGGRSNVTGHIKIADNVHLAGLSVVTKEISQPGQYGGYPLQPLQQALKTKSSLPHLPELRKEVSRILKHLGLATKSTESESPSNS